MPSDQEKAEMVAIAVLGWMAQNEDVLGQFLNASGAATEDLRHAVQDLAFLGALLDFVMQEDAWVIAACDSQSLPYDALMRARAALPGGDIMHWT